MKAVKAPPPPFLPFPISAPPAEPASGDNHMRLRIGSFHAMHERAEFMLFSHPLANPCRSVI